MMNRLWGSETNGQWEVSKAVAGVDIDLIHQIPDWQLQCYRKLRCAKSVQFLSFLFFLVIDTSFLYVGEEKGQDTLWI